MTPVLRTAAVALAAVLTLLVGASRATAQAPAVSAPSAIVMESTTGDVAHAKAADVSRPIASATKLMTALLTLERADFSDRYPAARYVPLPVESKLGLRPGERLSVRDLLRGLMLESANDAAVTLAEGVAGSREAFVRLMNVRARALGLRATRFEDPIGIGSGNRSSARDLAQLTRRLREHRFFRRLVARPSVVLRSGDAPRRVANRNTLVSRPEVDGVKTGHTLRAGWVLVGSGARGEPRRRVHVITVVLAAPTEAARNADTLALLRWGLRRYRVRTAVREGARLALLPVRHRPGASVGVVAGDTVRRVTARGRRLTTRLVGLPTEVQGPLPRGRRLGTVEVLLGGRPVARAPLITAAAVPEATVAQRAKASLSRPFTVALALAALGGSVLLLRLALIRRERRVRRSRESPKIA